jgi:hypothetical protein
MSDLIKPVQEWPCLGGTHKVYKFPNKYGASVIVRDDGPCEMRVVRWGWGRSFLLDRSTTVDVDAAAVRSADAVPGVLDRIRALPYGGAT